MEMFRDAYDNAWKSVISPYQHRHNLIFHSQYLLQQFKNIQIK